MEFIKIPSIQQDICRIGIGTWALGGWQWGGTNERESIAVLHRAFELGINFIDTSPVYGFGLSEEIIGKALKSYTGRKDLLVIATKVGLDWHEGSVVRDSRKERILQEIEESLKRLGISAIDLYQIHWPDFETPFEECAEAMNLLLEQGKIRAIGVSNYTANMMEAFRKCAPIHTLQAPYNLFERGIETIEVPYCKENGIALLGYGLLCRGLLSGRMQKNTVFAQDDIRQLDPKFHEPHFHNYLNCVHQLQRWVAGKYNRSMLELALRWSLDKGIEVAIWGVRRPEQLDLLQHVWDWSLNAEDMQEIDNIVKETISVPIDAEFMAPPACRNSLKNL